MPTNAGPEYGAAEAEFQQASNNEEKIRALEKMYSLAPKHKSSEGLLNEIKQKLSKFKEKEEKEKAKKGGGGLYSIKKEGAAQVVLIGPTNSGKSWILSKLTGAKVQIASYPFTTKLPEQGTMDFEGVKIQLVEIPAFFDGFYNSEKGPALFAILRECDLIVVVLDGEVELAKQLKMVEDELRKGGIILDGIQKPGIYAKKCIVVVNKKFDYVNTIHKLTSFEDIKQNIWNNLNVIYVQTKMPGKKADWPPVALHKGDTIYDLAEKVHKDFLDKFDYAKIWGASVKHNATSVGLHHELACKDIVEFHLR